MFDEEMERGITIVSDERRMESIPSFTKIKCDGCSEGCMVPKQNNYNRITKSLSIKFPSIRLGYHYEK